MTDAAERPRILLPAVLFEGGLLGVAIGLGAILATPPFGDAAVTPLALLIGAVATGPPLVGVIRMSRWRVGPVRRLLDAVRRTVAPLFAGCSVLQLAAIAAAAGLAEEALFRGVIQAALVERIGPVLGLLGASVLFGLAHLVTPLYAVLAGLVGLYLGTLHLLTGTVVVPIVVHALYDLGALLYLTRGSLGDRSSAPPLVGEDSL